MVYGTAINEPVYIYNAATDTRYYLLKDDQNSVVALYNESDTSGAIPRERYEYSAYGRTNLLDGSGVIKKFDHDKKVSTDDVPLVKSDFYNPFGFQGMWRDEHTGLYHTHYRIYNPQHVRWLTPDPAGYRDGQNLYRFYAGPNGVDPLGLNWFWNTLEGYDNYVNGTIRGTGKGAYRFGKKAVVGVAEVAKTAGGNIVNAASLTVGGDVVFTGAANSAEGLRQVGGAVKNAAVEAYFDPEGAAKKAYNGTLDALEKKAFKYEQLSFEERWAGGIELGLDVATVFYGAGATKAGKLTTVTNSVDNIAPVMTKVDNLAPVVTKGDNIAPVVNNKVDDVLPDLNNIDDLTPAIYDTKFAAQQLLDGGEISLERLKSFVPKDSPNLFTPSNNISYGQKYQFNINGQSIEVKFHSPDLGAKVKHPGSNSGSNFTAQIKIGKKLLGSDGKLHNKASNITHIIIKELK